MSTLPGSSTGELGRILTSWRMPFRERHQLLLAAGFAPLYTEASRDAASFAIVRHALERMLTQHGPFPALVMDRYWNVVLANERQSGCWVHLQS